MEDNWIKTKDWLPELKYKWDSDDTKFNLSDIFLVLYKENEKKYITTGRVDMGFGWMIQKDDFTDFDNPKEVTHYMKLPKFNDNRWINSKKQLPEITEQYFHEGDELLTDEEDLEGIKLQKCSKDVLIIIKTTIHHFQGIKSYRNIRVGNMYWFRDWCVSGDNISTGGIRKVQITHWMPLPNEPK